jgi:nitrate/nitrite transporter NarK
VDVMICDIGWFDGKEKSFAMGINLSLARAGTVINDWLSPWLYNHMGLSTAFWWATIICMASFLAGTAAVSHSHLSRYTLLHTSLYSIIGY